MRSRQLCDGHLADMLYLASRSHRVNHTGEIHLNGDISRAQARDDSLLAG